MYEKLENYEFDVNLSNQSTYSMVDGDCCHIGSLT